MAQTQLRADGRTSIDLFQKAIELWLKKYRRESEKICRHLLTRADINDYHKAGCHRILSLGDNNNPYHAKQALELYENLFIDALEGSFETSGPASPRYPDFEHQRACIEIARRTCVLIEKHEAQMEANYQRELENFRDVWDREPFDDEVFRVPYNLYDQEEEAFCKELEGSVWKDMRGQWLEDSAVVSFESADVEPF